MMVLRRIRTLIRRPNVRSSSPVRRKPPVSSRRRKRARRSKNPHRTRPEIKRRIPNPQVPAHFPLEGILMLPRRKSPGTNPRRPRASPPPASTMPWTCWKWLMPRRTKQALGNKLLGLRGTQRRVWTLIFAHSLLRPVRTSPSLQRRFKVRTEPSTPVICHTTGMCSCFLARWLGCLGGLQGTRVT